MRSSLITRKRKITVDDLRAVITPPASNGASQPLVTENNLTDVIVQDDKIISEIDMPEKSGITLQNRFLGFLLLQQQPIISYQEAQIATSLLTETKKRSKEPEHRMDGLNSCQATLFSQKLLFLQSTLVNACEQGDMKAVQEALKAGAQIKTTHSKDKQPLGAAVWGMNPKVVNELLKHMNDHSPMMWEECKRHNLKWYQEIFIVPQFNPRSIEEWRDLLRKMNPSPFVRSHHLKCVDEVWEDGDSASWNSLCCWAKNTAWTTMHAESIQQICRETEKEYAQYRTQIKQKIETTSQLTLTPYPFF